MSPSAPVYDNGFLLLFWMSYFFMIRRRAMIDVRKCLSKTKIKKAKKERWKWIFFAPLKNQGVLEQWYIFHMIFLLCLMAVTILFFLAYLNLPLLTKITDYLSVILFLIMVLLLLMAVPALVKDADRNIPSSRSQRAAKVVTMGWPS